MPFDPGRSDPGAPGELSKLLGPKRGSDANRAVMQRQFTPAKDGPGPWEKPAGQPMPLKIDGNDRPAGYALHFFEQPHNPLLGEVMQQQAANHQVEG